MMHSPAAPTRRFLSDLPQAALQFHGEKPEEQTKTQVAAERRKLLRSRSLPSPQPPESPAISQAVPDISKIQRAILTLGLTCATALGQRSRIVRRFAFFPPSPPGYKLRLSGRIPKKSEGLFAGCLGDPAKKSPQTKTLVVNECSFLLNVQRVGGLPEASTLLTRIPGCHLQLTSGLLHWKGKSEATCPFVFYWKFIPPVNDDVKCSMEYLTPKYLKQRPLIIFSHGNNTDIGHNFISTAQLATRLHVNVLTYDYPGYGAAKGDLTEKGCLQNLKMCYHYAVNVLRVPASMIIAYGQSIGTVMTCALAKRFTAYPLAGVILHSPLASGLRLVLGDKATNKNFIDVFRNDKAILGIPWPIQIIHGGQDKLVPLLHSERLAQLARDCSKCRADARALFVRAVAKKVQFGAALFRVIVDPQETLDDNELDVFEKYWPARVNIWVAREAGHNDVEIIYKNEYFRILRDFIVAYAQA